MKRNVLILAALAVLFLLPIISNINYWGGRDWGFHMYQQSVAKTEILDYKQIPFWDPFRCGGNVFLAHPEGPMFSPTFILTLLLPVIVSIKLALLVNLFIGLLGAYFLAKKLGINGYSCLLLPIVYILNSSFFLYLAEGNFWYRGIAWIPWVAFFYLKAEDDKRWAVPAGISVLFILFDTNTYAFGVAMFFLFAWAAFDVVLKRRWTYVTIFIIALLSIVALGAFKLLPMYNFARQFPVVNPDKDSGYSWESLRTGLLDTDQGPYSHFFADKRPFFHHGVYVGWIPLMLAALGVILYWRSKFKWILLFFFSLWVAFGKNAPISLYAIIKTLPLTDYFHEATRFSPLFMLSIGVFAALALWRLERLETVSFGEKKYSFSQAQRTVVILAILAFITWNMWSVNTAYLGKVFIAPPLQSEPGGEFVQINSAYGSNPWTNGALSQDIYHNVWGHAMYINFLSNKGTVHATCHGSVGENAEPSIFANNSINPKYKGETYLASNGSRGNAAFAEWTPNKFVVNADSSENNILFVNQNYYSEWRVSGSSGDLQTSGLLATDISPGTSQVTFYYSKTLFLLGLLITLASIVAVVYGWKNWPHLLERFQILRE